MSDAKDPAQTLREINAQAAFNQWAAFEVLHADADGVVLGISWREEFGHYAGFLHAGMTAALIDTACGFAAVVATGSRDGLAPVGELPPPRYRAALHGQGAGAEARSGQIFTSCELFAHSDDGEKPVASGETLLVAVGDRPPAS